MTGYSLSGIVIREGGIEVVEALGANDTSMHHERGRLLHREPADRVTLGDLEFREATRDERDAGPVRLTFRIALFVHLDDGWQQCLIDHLLSARTAQAT